jgi:hypothetical protein
MRASQQASMYETAHRMRQVLTDEQRQMLDGLTPQQMMRQMMSRMPMMDMMQMMRSMHGGGMMSGKMMQGMMQHQSMMRGMHPRRMQQDRQNQ